MITPARPPARGGWKNKDCSAAAILLSGQRYSIVRNWLSWNFLRILDGSAQIIYINFIAFAATWLGLKAGWMDGWMNAALFYYFSSQIERNLYTQRNIVSRKKVSRSNFEPLVHFYGANMLQTNMRSMILYFLTQTVIMQLHPSGLYIILRLKIQ